MSTLYALTAEYKQLLEFAREEEIDEQVFLDTLEGLEGEIEIKADGYAKVIKELEAEAKKFKEEKDRLEKHYKSIENRISTLKNNLKEAMTATGKTKFKTDYFSFSINKNAGLQPMKIVEGAIIPDEYCVKSPDNSKIREALKQGVELEFAHLCEYGNHLRIK